MGNMIGYKGSRRRLLDGSKRIYTKEINCWIVAYRACGFEVSGG